MRLVVCETKAIDSPDIAKAGQNDTAERVHRLLGESKSRTEDLRVSETATGAISSVLGLQLSAIRLTVWRIRSSSGDGGSLRIQLLPVPASREMMVQELLLACLNRS